MSRMYDNWERLVGAVLKREELRQIAMCESLSSSSSINSTSLFIPDFPNFLDINETKFKDVFSYHQILEATDEFNDENLIKLGHSGDIFYGTLERGIPVVIKKVDLYSPMKRKSYMSESSFLTKVVSHPRIVPLLGHCLENKTQKFLVYKHMRNGDLSSSLFKKTHSDDSTLRSLDWITRLKIAIGVAEGLVYLHHECVPPHVHRDIQASSILLDDGYEVRLGSLSEVYAQEGDTRLSRMIRLLLRFPRALERDTPGTPNATCAYDVYCFGKVLLELVTGKLGISSSNESTVKEFLETTLLYISIYDKELVTNIVDPSLIIDEDLLEEVWAMAVVARSCLNPMPDKRPIMRYVLKALENPLKVVRDENTTSSTRSGGLSNAAPFDSRRQSSSDVAAAGGPVADASPEMDGMSGDGLEVSWSQGSGQNGDSE
ncbi:hypothetical protein ABFX02_02G023200 [Erythranthe guttata]